MKKLFESFNKFIKEEAEVIKFGKRVNPNRYQMFIDQLQTLVDDYSDETATVDFQTDNYGQIVIFVNTNLKRNEDGELIMMTQKDFEN